MRISSIIVSLGVATSALGRTADGRRGNGLFLASAAELLAPAAKLDPGWSLGPCESWSNDERQTIENPYPCPTRPPPKDEKGGKGDGDGDDDEDEDEGGVGGAGAVPILLDPTSNSDASDILTSALKSDNGANPRVVAGVAAAAAVAAFLAGFLLFAFRKRRDDDDKALADVTMDEAYDCDDIEAEVGDIVSDLKTFGGGAAAGAGYGDDGSYVSANQNDIGRIHSGMDVAPCISTTCPGCSIHPKKNTVDFQVC